MLQYLFKAVLITSFSGTALALLLTLFKPLTKKHFSPRWHYYIWLVVLVSMLLPVRITPLQRSGQAELVEYSAPVAVEKINGITETPLRGYEEKETNRESSFDKLEILAESKVKVMSVVWLLGVILSFCVKLISYFLFLIRLSKNSQAISCPELKEFTDRKITTRISKSISSPLMTGIFRPILLLPDIRLTEEQLNNVLSHEMVHFKRKDICYKWFVALAKCVHWFNPAVYFISNCIDEECEISCDMAVVKSMTREQELCYVNTILTLLAAGNSKTAALTTGMTGNRKRLKRRFTMIKNKFSVSKKTAVISIIIAIVVLAGTVIAGGLINGKFLEDNGNVVLNTDETDGSRFNFLILGTDNQNRADTIMLLSFNEKGVTGLSIPRDTPFTTDMADGKTRKISDILAEEDGDNKVVNAVRNKLSVPIHYYAKVNLSAVKDVVDSVGGIEMNVPVNMSYEDPHQNLKIELKAGNQLLNGEQLCGLLRYRGYKDGDITRISIAQNFVNEFVKQKLNGKNADKLPEIYKIVKNNITTNFSFEKLFESMDMLKSINIDEIEFYTLPGTVVNTENGIPVYETNHPETNEILNNMGYTEEKTTSEQDGKEQTKLSPLSLVRPCNGEITAVFGVREHPVTGAKLEHNGIDIKAPEGTEVVSSFGGSVTETGYDSEKGNYIVVEQNGVKTIYAQLLSVSVNKGDSVTSGQKIGEVGKTGTATGAHLHFEVIINGTYVDPQQYF